jgi:hypothetical protein
MRTFLDRTAAAVGGLALLIGLSAGCATRPDIRGDNDEAREWAAQQKKEEAERKRTGYLPPPTARPAEPAPTPPPAAPPAPAN